MSVNQITIYASAHSKQKLRPTRIREKSMFTINVKFYWRQEGCTDVESAERNFSLKQNKEDVLKNIVHQGILDYQNLIYGYPTATKLYIQGGKKQDFLMTSVSMDLTTSIDEESIMILGPLYPNPAKINSQDEYPNTSCPDIYIVTANVQNENDANDSLNLAIGKLIVKKEGSKYFVEDAIIAKENLLPDIAKIFNQQYPNTSLIFDGEVMQKYPILSKCCSRV